ncbi:MAG: Glycosyl transferase, group 2 family protein [Candidatus Magasanikbacteria bacterium GW2011_GWA2_37_8]|uniref:Glycosyl transferase, group 2 family protein n=1 Tax=Candidatus Magasanikbacteria bacterium GW2011_GWA2_37_8 TaxID=1619036 RepID=A0A0G0HPX8_9BACT|nr:MAG: Glycosyl transferase, group 2 family protein [Candidatus Magasanikbacteria bacterium GW2011_GWA2_37_8]
MKTNITFLIFTYNEEKRIGFVIRNLIKYGEVLVLDDGSTDKTKEITEKLGGRFVVRPKLKIYYAENQEMFNFIKPLVNTDWVFWGYTDNFMPKSLLDKLVEITKSDIYKYVFLPINTYNLGKTDYPMEKGYSPRFFMKDYVDFSDNYVHGIGRFVGSADEVLKLPMEEKYSIRHFSVYDIKKFVTNHMRIADIEANERFVVKKRFSIFRMLVSMLRYFYIYYRNGYKNGSVGLISALSMSFFRFMMFARLYEIENNITIDSIENQYIIKKEEIIKEIENK